MTPYWSFFNMPVPGISAGTLASYSPVSVTAHKERERRPEIEGLRALAVMAVIINHMHREWLPSGYLGVDIFFVISGYVITSSLFGRREIPLAPPFFDFYERRIKRLAPALLLFVFVASILIVIVNPQPAQSLATGIASLFGVSNFYLLRQAANYFSESTELNIFTHIWSLAVEEQFYFVYPCLVWLVGFGSDNRGKLFMAVMLPLIVVSWGHFTYFYASRQSDVYYMMGSRFWEMGAGCMLFMFEQSNMRKCDFITLPATHPDNLSGNHISNIIAQQAIPLIALTFLIMSLFAPLAVAVNATLAAVVFTVSLVASLRPNTIVFTLFANPVMIYVGKISYSLYLWHWGVLCLSRWTIGISTTTLPVLAVVMVSLAVASTHLVEMPLRQKKWTANSWRTIIVGIGCSTCVAGFIMILLHSSTVRSILYVNGQPPSYSATDTFNPIRLVNMSDLVTNSSVGVPVNDMFASRVEETTMSTISTNPIVTTATSTLRPLRAIGVSSITWFHTVVISPTINWTWEGGKCCIDMYDHTKKTMIPIEGCTLGNFETAKKRILVIGNSFSITFISAFDTLVGIDGYAVIMTSAYGAPPIREGDGSFLGPFQASSAYYWRTVVPNLLAKLRPGDIVFDISDMSFYMPTPPAVPPVGVIDQIRIGFTNFANELAVRQISLVVMDQFTLAREAQCKPEVAIRYLNGGNCELPSREALLQRRGDIHNILADLEQQKKLKTVDLINIFCPHPRCTYAAHGVILYRDEWSHPSVDAAEIAAPTIRNAILSL